MNMHEYERQTFQNISTYHVKDVLFSYILPLILLMGLVGNVLVVLVLSRSCFRVSTYTYLFALSCFDQIVLFACSKNWLEHVWKLSLESHSLLFCQTIHFISSFSSMVSSWLTVAVTIERFLVVVKPLHARTYTMVRSAQVTICILILLSLAVNSHFYITLELVSFRIRESELSNSYIWFCGYKVEYEEGFQAAWTWIDGILYCYAPFCLIFPANIVIFMKITLAKRNRDKMTNVAMQCSNASSSTLLSVNAALRHGVDNRKTLLTAENSSANLPPSRRISANDSQPLQAACVVKSKVLRKRASQKTVMPLVISGFFLFTVTPVCVMKTLMATLLSEPQNDPHYRAGLSLLNALLELLMVTNHASNFFLYCTLGAKFRHDLRLMFLVCTRRCQTRQEPPVGISLTSYHPGRYLSVSRPSVPSRRIQ